MSVALATFGYVSDATAYDDPIPLVPEGAATLDLVPVVPPPVAVLAPRAPMGSAVDVSPNPAPRPPVVTVFEVI